MQFNIDKSIEILQRTPSVLENLLSGLSREWLHQNEGENTWSPYDVLGHLIVGEKTDWVPRARIILSNSESKTFEPFDRFAQMSQDQDRTIESLLDEFSELRAENLKELTLMQIDELKLLKEGVHPELGGVNLKELLSCWTVHDLGHIAQISRVMAKQYKEEVGPWSRYLGILKS